MSLLVSPSGCSSGRVHQRAIRPFRGDGRLGARAAAGAAGVRGAGGRPEPRRRVGPGDRGDAEGGQLGDAVAASCCVQGVKVRNMTKVFLLPLEGQTQAALKRVF